MRRGMVIELERTMGRGIGLSLSCHLLDFLWTRYMEYNEKHEARLARLPSNRRPTTVGPASLSISLIHVSG